MEKVDVDKLERELLDALRADRKYSRENDAKFRAINQRVQTYEEFRCVATVGTTKCARDVPPVLVMNYCCSSHVFYTIDSISPMIINIYSGILSRHHIWPHLTVKSYLTQQEISLGIQWPMVLQG